MKKLLKMIFVATCVIGAPTFANAYPFLPDPNSFQNYMNTRSWASGSKVIFQNLNTCIDSTRPDDFNGEPIIKSAVKMQVAWGAPHSYGCYGGFATINDPTGTKVCSITQVEYITSGKYSYRDTGNCRYK